MLSVCPVRDGPCLYPLVAPPPSPARRCLRAAELYSPPHRLRCPASPTFACKSHPNSHSASFGKWPTTNSGWRESLVAEGFDGIEAGGARCGIESGDEADDDRERDGAQSQPPGNIGYFYAGQILAVKINGGAPSQRGPNQPAKCHAEKT